MNKKLLSLLVHHNSGGGAGGGTFAVRKNAADGRQRLQLCHSPPSFVAVATADTSALKAIAEESRSRQNSGTSTNRGGSKSLSTTPVRELLAQGAKAFARSIDGEGLAQKNGKAQQSNVQATTTFPLAGESISSVHGFPDSHHHVKTAAIRAASDGNGEEHGPGLAKNVHGLDLDTSGLLGTRHHSAPASPLSWAQHAEGVLARAAAYQSFLSSAAAAQIPAVQIYNSALAAAAAAAAAGIPLISTQSGLNFLTAQGQQPLGSLADAAAAAYPGIRLSSLAGSNGSSAFIPSIISSTAAVAAAASPLKRSRPESPLTTSGDGAPAAKSSRTD